MKSRVMMISVILVFFNACTTVLAEDKIISLSATSETSGHPVANALDGSSSTYWQPGGDSQDEGVTIRFVKAIKLESFRINASGSGLDFQVYVNGSSQYNTAANITVPSSLENVKSLYIRILPGAKNVKIKEIVINNGEITPLKIVKATVKASSELTPAISYGAGQLFDGRLDFGWSEGKSDDGIGEAVTITFNKKTSFDGLYIANGYQRSETHFKANNRVQAITIIADGKTIATKTLPDKMGYHKISLDKTVKASKVVLKIEKIYKGTKYKDTLLSEVKFVKGGQIIDVNSGFMQELGEQYKTKAQGTILTDLVGKYLSFELLPAHYKQEGQNISIKLRPNGSFVIWHQTYVGEEESSEIVMDGNWVIKKAKPLSATIEIFGKKRSTSMEVDWSDPYADPKYKDNTRIFKDRITIEYAEAVNIKGTSDLAITIKKYLDENYKEELLLIKGKTIFGVFPAQVER